MAVEFALLLPILIMILLGTLEFGLALNSQITISNAAREGARTMAIQNSTVAVITAVKSVASYVTPTIASSEIAISPSACTSGQTVIIRIEHPYKFLTGFFGIGYTMIGTAAMKCGG